jgi:cytidine deaminase
MAKAQAARAQAYAPYSQYQVGAAVQMEDGRVGTGSNIENISFGASVCAERVALWTLIHEQGGRWAEMAVATEDGGTPCGECLAVMAEFAAGRDAKVWLIAADGDRTCYTFGELMPHAFSSRAPFTQGRINL